MVPSSVQSSLPHQRSRRREDKPRNDTYDSLLSWLFMLPALGRYTIFEQIMGPIPWRRKIGDG